MGDSVEMDGEQIDEVSKKMLQNRYLSKARDSEQTHRAYSYRYHGYDGEGHTPDHEEDEKDERKAEKRASGIAMARSKINKSGTAKVRATEEAEQVELNNQMDEGSFGMETAVAAGRKERIQRRIRDRQVIHHQNVDVHKAALPLSKKFRTTK